MGPERFALPQLSIPALHLRQWRPFDLQLEIAVERGAGGDVGERQIIAEQKPPALEQPVELFEMPAQRANDARIAGQFRSTSGVR